MKLENEIVSSRKTCSCYGNDNYQGNKKQKIIVL